MVNYEMGVSCKTINKDNMTHCLPRFKNIFVENIVMPFEQRPIANIKPF